MIFAPQTAGRSLSSLFSTPPLPCTFFKLCRFQHRADCAGNQLTNEFIQEATLRHRLREETDAIHQSLHRNPGLQKLVSAECTTANYRDVLRVFYHFYQGVDDRFNSIPTPQRFTYEATPLRWLQQDFLALNQPLPERSFSTPANAEIGTRAPRLENYIGYLYVKQGSTLGGQMISKQLKKTLALEPGVTQFFFYGFGEHTGYYWKEFLNYLAHHEASLDADAVIQSAQFYFNILDQLSKRYFPFGGINE